MKLPEEIEKKILSDLNLPDLYNDPGIYQNELDILRKQMVKMSEEFALCLPAESKYTNAYFCFNFPQNFMKSIWIARRLYNLYKIPILNKEFKILDIGCGEGAGMFGLYYYLYRINAEHKFSLLGVDIDEILLKRCKSISDWFKELNHHINVELIKETALQFVKKEKDNYDVIILANSLIEIFPSGEIPIYFIQYLMKLLKKDGIIIIIEPALKNLTRRLMVLRERLIKDGIATVLLPCLHSKSCSALLKKEEWCHQSIRWTPPDYLKILNKKLYRKIEYLKFSYLILRRDGYESTYGNRYPVISRLFNEKGRRRVLVCTENGIVELMRLNKDCSDKNQDFKMVNMGDIIEIYNEVKIKPLFWKIAKCSGIKRLDF